MQANNLKHSTYERELNPTRLNCKPMSNDKTLSYKHIACHKELVFTPNKLLPLPKLLSTGPKLQTSYGQGRTTTTNEPYTQTAPLPNCCQANNERRLQRNHSEHGTRESQGFGEGCECHYHQGCHKTSPQRAMQKRERDLLDECWVLVTHAANSYDIEKLTQHRLNETHMNKRDCVHIKGAPLNVCNTV